ncbi:hypothetical protein NPIL_473501 [Nephila pilipes]|uniref:Uncharacterized protein n=1 Tax=Nephila pilipes TaxID=299642 RepID=A0A8X6N1I1_NEPPI|nr:hypothetical protein NPIL_473501 [Nephila pilipes]
MTPSQIYPSGNNDLHAFTYIAANDLTHKKRTTIITAEKRGEIKKISKNGITKRFYYDRLRWTRKRRPSHAHLFCSERGAEERRRGDRPESIMFSKNIFSPVFIPGQEFRENGRHCTVGCTRDGRRLHTGTSMGSEPIHANTVSVPIAWATFGGSTCLLFLLCYICQKKLHEQEAQSDTPSQQVYVISSVPRTNQADGIFRQAPPDYESAVCLKRLQIEEPPSYETAIATKNKAITLAHGGADLFQVPHSHCPEGHIPGGARSAQLWNVLHRATPHALGPASGVPDEAEIAVAFSSSMDRGNGFPIHSTFYSKRSILLEFFYLSSP